MYLTPSWRHFDRGSGRTDRGQFSRPELVFGATGAGSLFVREALLDVALDGQVFDETFHSFREDAELAFRLQDRGWSVVYEPAAAIEHRRFNLPSRRAHMPPEVNFHALKNRYLLRLYHQTPGNLLVTCVPTAVRELGILLYTLLRERSSLAVYRWLWHHRSQAWQRRKLVQQRRTVAPRSVNRWFWQKARTLPEVGPGRLRSRHGPADLVDSARRVALRRPATHALCRPGPPRTVPRPSRLCRRPLSHQDPTRRRRGPRSAPVHEQAATVTPRRIRHPLRGNGGR